jgi:hypothetical protein
MLRDVANTEFMHEPAWRWFIAIGAFTLMAMAWRGTIDYMK